MFTSLAIFKALIDVYKRQSLDQAIDCLIDLQQDGKLIGIISHVSELKERIDHKIILSRVNKETYISIE